MFTFQRSIIIVGFITLSGCSMQPAASDQTSQSSKTDESTSSVSSAMLSSDVSEVTPDDHGMVIDDHIQFSVGDLKLHVRKEFSDVRSEIEGLVSPNNDRCGAAFDPSYAQKLTDAYASGERMFYTVYDPTIVMNPSLYYIEVIPNRMEYKDFESVDADFKYCAVGSLPVVALSPKWIVFANSACGGASTDGDLCETVRQTIEPSIELR